MAPQALAYTYCTQTDVEAYMSTLGVRDRLDDDEDGNISAAEQVRLTDCIINATETVNFYTIHRYKPQYLAQSNWVCRRATELATYDLCTCRGNPAPTSVAERAKQAQDWLEQIHNIQYKVPLIPERRVLAPSWSSLRANPRYNFKVIRVELNTGSTTEPTQATAQPQFPDWTEAYSFEI